jgi:glc operon protein GlcG
MQHKPALTLSDVNLVLDAAQKEAENNGWAVTIAIADDGGHLLGLRRLDSACPITSHIATEKAHTAALTCKETKVFEEMINKGRTAFLSAPRLKGVLEGGIPIKVDGQVAGSVGVSGVTPVQDAQVAKAGIQALLAQM